MTTNNHNQTEALKVAREALSAITDKIGGTSFATSIAFGACLDAIETIDDAISATAAPVQQEAKWKALAMQYRECIEAIARNEQRNGRCGGNALSAKNALALPLPAAPVEAHRQESETKDFDTWFEDWRKSTWKPLPSDIANGRAECPQHWATGPKMHMQIAWKAARQFGQPSAPAELGEHYQAIREALALLNSMVACGEDHTEASRVALAKAISSLNALYAAPVAAPVVPEEPVIANIRKYAEELNAEAIADGFAGSETAYRLFDLLDAAAPVAQSDTAQPKDCTSCDGTGDVHDATGEYRGKCPCAQPQEALTKERILQIRDEQLSKAGFESNEVWLVNFAHAIAMAAQASPAVPDTDRKDAERYRWLKTVGWQHGVPNFAGHEPVFKIEFDSPNYGWNRGDDNIDDAIDAAIAALEAQRSDG